MTATSYLRLAQRWWWLLLAALLTGALAALVATSLMSPTYESSATLLVAPARPPGTTVERTELEASALLTNTYRTMITARPILERASTENGLGLSSGGLASRLSVRSTTGSQVIEVSATAESGSRAQAIVAAVTETFVAAPEVARVGGPDSVTILSPASLPSSPVTPQPRLNAILGGLLALAITGVVLLAVEHADNRVRPDTDVERVARLPVLSRLRRFHAIGNGLAHVRAALRRGTALGEEFRTARASLVHAMSVPEGQTALHRTLLVASPSEGDGRTTVAASLAVAFGITNYRVLLVDADLRAPSLHRLFGAESPRGLGDLLADPALSVEDAAQPAVTANVDLLLGTPRLPSPSELLASPRMREVLAEARQRYDLVIIDSPPMVEASDALVLAGFVDSAVLLAREGNTRETDLRTAADQLQRSQAEVVGVIVNGVAQSDGPDRLGWDGAFTGANAVTRLLRERVRSGRVAIGRMTGGDR